MVPQVGTNELNSKGKEDSASWEGQEGAFHTDRMTCTNAQIQEIADTWGS